VGRHEVEAYLEKLFDWSALLTRLPEERQHPQHSCQKVFAAVFWGALGRIPSFHQLEYECRAGGLRHRIGPLSEDTLRYSLERLAPEAVLALGCEVARRLKRNGVLRTDAAQGLVVAAVDGIEICQSYVRCCDTCLERKVERMVDGVKQSAVQYYHRIVAVAVVSTAFPIPLGLRFQAPGEGEVACAQTLVEDLVGQLGRRFVDVLVGDALYLGTPVIDAIEGLGLDWVVTIKDNQPELVAELARRTCEGTPAETVTPDVVTHLWHVPDVHWAAGDRSVRCVQEVRRAAQTHMHVEREGGHRTHHKTVVWEESTTLYASSLRELSCSPEGLVAVGRSRWRIDTEVFQTLTKECHLKHPAVHQHHDQAFVVLTMIRVLAYTLLLVFFHRQVLSHARHTAPTFCQLARQIVPAFASGHADSS
jgi:hypothetical protein